MARQSCRVTVRLPSEQRQKMSQLIVEGKEKNISSMVRAALEESLDERGPHDTRTILY